MFEIGIVWGEYPDDPTDEVIYHFNSTAEINAFVRGIDEAMGKTLGGGELQHFHIVYRNDGGIEQHWEVDNDDD